MRVMGIDPGTRVVGYGVLDHVGNRFRTVVFGAIRADTAQARPLRYLQIFDGLVDVMRQHSPDEIAIERIFSGKNPQSAIQIGEGRGLALLAAGQAKIPVSEYAATVVKKAVVGSGAGSKAQVQELVRILLKLDKAPTPRDASDALAIAICHCNRNGVESALKRAGGGELGGARMSESKAGEPRNAGGRKALRGFPPEVAAAIERKLERE